MKNLLTSILFFLFFGLTTIAQDTKLQSLKDFNTWTIQGNINANYGHTDIVYNDLFYKDVNANLGYGARFMKYLSPYFSIGTDLYTSKLHGLNKELEYNTNIHLQVSVLAQFQTGNARYINDFKRFQLYGYVGYGSVNFSSKLTNKNTSQKTTYMRQNAQVIPVGVGIKYKLKDHVTLNLEYTYNAVNTDYLDAFRNPLTDYDYYSKFQLGISQTLLQDEKSSKKDLEWY